MIFPYLFHHDAESNLTGLSTSLPLSTGGGGPGGLSMSDMIALGVGIGVGLPSAIAATWQMCRWLGYCAPLY
jgi:hypothetical protein